MSPEDLRSRRGDINQSQDMRDADEPSSQLKSSLLEPRVQSFGSSTNEIDAKMSLASPRIGPENTRNLLLLSQDVQEPVESRGFQSLNPAIKDDQTV